MREQGKCLHTTIDRPANSPVMPGSVRELIGRQGEPESVCKCGEIRSHPTHIDIFGGPLHKFEPQGEDVKR